MLLTVKSATEGERHRIHRSIAAAHAGGLPVKVGEDVIGGVGVSGSPGVDEPCVQDGLDKVADQLK